MSSADAGRRGAARQRALEWLWWAVAWGVTASLIAAVHYTTGDPDSRLYAGLSAQLSTLPVSRWIAPEWRGLWGLSGLYYEHPVGMFVVPAAFARLGYPAAQAAFAINALYQVLAFVLLGQLARVFVSDREARAVSWLVQLIPIAFVFRIRANQEYAVLMGILFALYATERALAPSSVAPRPCAPGIEGAEPCAPPWKRAVWTLGMIAGCLWVLFVKGVFAFQVPVVCVLWLFTRATRLRDAVGAWPVWLALVGMAVAAVLSIQLYDAAYAHATGRSFLELYRSRQVPEGALTQGDPALRTAYTLVWYIARVIWYAFPWSLAALFFAVPRLCLNSTQGRASALSSSAGMWARASGVAFATLSSAALVVAFSLAHRKADRYIFPVYFIVAAAGSTAVVRRIPFMTRVAAQLDRPWMPALVYVLLILLRIVTRGHLPEFTFWRS